MLIHTQLRNYSTLHADYYAPPLQLTLNPHASIEYMLSSLLLTRFFIASSSCRDVPRACRATGSTHPGIPRHASRHRTDGPPPPLPHKTK